MVEIPQNEYLGKLCKLNHNWNGTEKSLRQKSSRCCAICRKRYQREYKKLLKYKIQRKKYRQQPEVKEKEKKYRKKYFQQPEVKEYHKKYRQQHPEIMRQVNRKRRALKKNAHIERFSEQEIYIRDNYTCQICGKKVKMNKSFPHLDSPSIDHIIPLSLGGEHSIKNVQLAHFGCNSRKHNGYTKYGEQLRFM